MNLAFWRGRRVFVTGHTGFKGSWLCLWLQQLGAEVWGYALEPASSSALFHRAGVANGMHSQYGDVRDAAGLLAALQRAQPEVVLHMAAQALVRASYEEPAYTFETNVMGTVNLLQAVRQTACVRAVVNVTTDKVYENREQVRPYREDEALGGFDPYSSSKACSEIVAAAYRRSFLAAAGVGLACARAGNVIGGGDESRDRLIPDLVRSFSRGETLRLRYPHAVRPWQWVLEPLRGYLLLAERLAEQPETYAQAWNLGPRAEDAWSVAQVATHLAQHWGEGARWEALAAAQPHEAQALRLDITKAAALLNWHPLTGLPQGLQALVQWYKAALQGADVRQITLAQLSHYQALVSKQGLT